MALMSSMQAYDMQYLHHSNLCPLGKSRKNPHRISASFYEDAEMDPRPHVKMMVATSNFWALLDTGASISLCTKKAVTQLSKYMRLPVQNHKISVQDCHSNIKQTERGGRGGHQFSRKILHLGD